MRALVLFLNSITDEKVIEDFYKIMDSIALYEIMVILDYCDDEAQKRWIGVYNRLFSFK